MRAASSARRAKSAERIDGAMRTGRLMRADLRPTAAARKGLGRYNERVAVPRIHRFNAATGCPFGARMVNGPGHPWLGRGTLVCHAVLVECDAGLVLVDTGLGREDVARPRERLGVLTTTFTSFLCDPAETAHAQVTRLGFRPDDVAHVIPTHLDFDHAGGLVDFPRAQVHVHAAEHDAAMRRTALREKMRYHPVQWRHGPRWVVHREDGEAWLGFASVKPLPGCDDVLLVPLFGHTRGHCGVAVRTATGWTLHAGDAYFSGLQLDARPSCPPGLLLFQRAFAMHDERRRRNVARLRRLRLDHPDVTVHSAHCPHEFRALRGGGLTAAMRSG